MLRTAGLALPLAAGLLLLFACGTDTASAPAAPADTDSGAPDAKTGPDESDGGPTDDAEPPAEKFTPSFPQVESRGGSVIATPKVIPIVFKGDPLADQITTFVQKVAASDYWKDQAAEYGVGVLSAADTIVVDETPPTSIKSSEIETWITGKLTGASPAFGAPDKNTLYAVFYPSGTTITMEDGGFGQSCQGYGGYHYELQVSSMSVGYAVLPRCSDMSELGVATSHELFEWATDPFPLSGPAYNKLDDAHWAWQPVMIGELGDLCTFVDRDYPVFPEIGVTVQRQWSNKLSKDGAFPCAPKKSVTYLQVIPNLKDDITAPDFGSPSFDDVPAKGVLVPPGTSKTVDLLVYSDKPFSSNVPMRVLGYDELYGRKDETGFTYELETNYAKVGTALKLTIHAPKTKAFDVPMTFAYTGGPNNEANFWPFLVSTDAKLTSSMTSPQFGTIEPLVGHRTSSGLSALKQLATKKYRVWRRR